MSHKLSFHPCGIVAAIALTSVPFPNAGVDLAGGLFTLSLN